MNSYIESLKKYATFSGRSNRKEFWIFIGINLLIFLILAGLELALFPSTTRSELNLNPLTYIQLGVGLALLLPTIAVSVRRMHDIDKSGLWNLLFFIPLLGGIALIFFHAQDSDPDQNQYGQPTQAPQLQTQTI